MYILGIDPGNTGAIVMVDSLSNMCFALEIPIRKAKARGNEIIWTELALNLKREISCYGDPHVVYIERVGAMPGQGVASMFKFGYAAGGLHALVAYIGEPEFVQPRAWKKYFGLSADKESAVRMAEYIFDGHDGMFRGPRGGIKDGLAEAALIAVYGYHLQMENL